MRRLVVLLLVWSGCIRAELVVCQDGRACPVGLVCDDAHHGCIDQSQLDACTGLDPLSPCTAVEGGVCHDGVCLPVACGNGLLDPDEACDDGDLQIGDGCSADCLSDETCGNGVLDLIRGEACDDGGLLGHDGCDSVCAIEDLRWSNMTLSAPAYPWRSGASAAYDDGRMRAVQFGGLVAGVATSTTVEWDGHGWIDRTPLLTPSPRTGAAMAYDPKHQVIVLFGGIDGAYRFGDTWLWDGSRWLDVTPDDRSPQARGDAAMVYDPTRAAVVLFGGNGNNNQLDDTWQWDGTTWTPIPTTTSPSPRSGHQLGYDPSRGQLVLYGGSPPATDTWILGATTWVLQSASAAPGVRIRPSLAFDRSLQQLILVGGTSNQAWFGWTGTDWTKLGDTPAVVGGFSAVVYDVNRGHAVAFGTAYAHVMGVNKTWTPLVPAVPPAARGNMGATYDRARGRVVMFGGVPGAVDTYSDETWEFDGSSWYLRSPATVPPARAGAELAYDRDRKVVVMVGGETDVPDTSTWEWDGNDWREHPATTTPIVDGAIVYDAVRHQIVRFGGYLASAAIDELRVWDGSTWTVVSSPVRPSARIRHAMAFDERRQRVVLWGGTDGGTLADQQTWEWDGATWHANAVSAPNPRNSHRMVYDERRGEIVMFGGGNGDTWTYDGHWHRAVTPIAPAIRFAPTLAYNPSAGETLLFGGNALPPLAYHADVWRLRWEGSSYDACSSAVDLDGDHLVGCADRDCYGYCDPSCAPQTSCEGSDGSRCGDSVCSALENPSFCAVDCGPPASVCGDHVCTESIATCPGDCAP